MAYKYLINTEKDFEGVLSYLKGEDIFGLDTETNGAKSRFDLSLVGISLGFDDFGCYIPLTHYEGKQLPLDYVLGRLKPVLEDPSTNYVCHNTKYDETVFKVYGIDCQGSGDDTYVLNWLLNESAARGTRGLKPLVKEHLGITMDTYEDIINKAPKQRGVDRDYNFARVPIEAAVAYAADDAFYTLRLFRIFAERVREEKLWDAYANIERPVVRVVRDIEWTGLKVDKAALDHANTRYPEIIEEIEAEIFEEVGHVFNLDARKQLGVVLFEDIGIAGSKRVPRTKGGQYKTDRKTLEKYEGRNPIVKKILRRARIKKTWGMFVEGLFPHIQQDGRVHASFNPTGTVTGRFSSSKPNLQQLQGDEIEEIRVRDFFVPDDGNVFIVGDFGQIELRVMAHQAQDEAAIAAFNSGRKFHDETARKMFKLDVDCIPTTRQKFYAKAINFGIPYGRVAMTIADALNIPEAEAEEYMAMWHKGFPQVEPYRKDFIRRARQRGCYMRTISGRKRRLPDLASKKFWIRAAAERQCFNTLCQGSAADIIKLAMVQLAPKIKPLGAQILIQIHDELVVECPIEKAEEGVEIMRFTLENPLNGKNPLRLPLSFEPKIVNHWSEAK